jgi:hypothetical protein
MWRCGLDSSGLGWGFLWTGRWTFRGHKIPEISGLASWEFASREGFWCMHLIYISYQKHCWVISTRYLRTGLALKYSVVKHLKQQWLISSTSSTLKMEATGSSETLVTTYRTLRRQFFIVTIKQSIYTRMGHTVAYLVEVLCYNPKVAGSIPDEVAGFFHFTSSFQSQYDPGIDSASNRNEYQKYSWG